MQGRTFYRTMLDIFLNNVIVKSITSVVNFCKEQRYYSRKELKFFQNVPINNVKVDKYDNRFLFQVTK